MTAPGANLPGEFTGKVAMVTGAARGIGQASALAFARRGASVVVCDVLDDDGETIGQVEDPGAKAVYVRTDVSDSAAVRRAVRVAVDEFGRLDFAHNNAGISPVAPLADLDEGEWDRVLAINLTGVFLCMKHQVPELLKTGGAIVNTASVWGLVGAAGFAAYAASKHGIVGLTRSAARDYGAAGVRVNAVAPGPIQTAITAAVPEEAMRQTVARTAPGRYGQPSEVGEVVAWLCSSAASYVTGTVLPIDGGWLDG